MKTVAIGLTGSSGTLGKRIAHLIRASPNTALTAFRGDLCSDFDIRGWAGSKHIDTLIMSAAIVPLERALQNPLQTFDVNAFSNLKLVFSIRAGSLHRFRVCYISSSHVYSSAPHPLSEDSALSPQGTYGKSKLMGEKLLQAVAEELDFELLILRVFSFFSDDQHDSHLYPALLRKIAVHSDPSEEFELVGWNNVRDFSTSDEIARKVVALSLSNRTGIVNVGSGVATRVGDFASRVYGSPLIFREKDAAAHPTSLVADTSLLAEWMKDE